jgi:NRAMP (natural resistance-associated macrophage protein)-like metal ion transporter
VSAANNNPKQRRSIFSVLGPGLVTGAADDDPSGIGTYSQAGAQFGYGLAWTMFFGFPLLASIQAVCAQIGATTGKGIAQNLRQHYPRPLLQAVVMMLLVANVINLGADLGAMAEALGLLLPGPVLLYTFLFGAVSVGLEVIISYDRYVGILKWATLSLFAYVAVVFVSDVPLGEARWCRSSLSTSRTRWRWWRSSARRSVLTCFSGRPGRRSRSSTAAIPSR